MADLPSQPGARAGPEPFGGGQGTCDGITGPGQRVFSLDVQGKEFKGFDLWQKAGGPRRAYIETVPVEVTNGVLRIVLTPQVENPAIKAIEVIPESAAGGGVASAATLRVKAGMSEPYTDSGGEVWRRDSGFDGGDGEPGDLCSAG